MSEKICHCAKFQSSSCLILWFTKFKLCETTQCSSPLQYSGVIRPQSGEASFATLLYLKSWEDHQARFCIWHTTYDEVLQLVQKERKKFNSLLLLAENFPVIVTVRALPFICYSVSCQTSFKILSRQRAKSAIHIKGSQSLLRPTLQIQTPISSIQPDNTHRPSHLHD